MTLGMIHYLPPPLSKFLDPPMLQTKLVHKSQSSAISSLNRVHVRMLSTHQVLCHPLLLCPAGLLLGRDPSPNMATASQQNDQRKLLFPIIQPNLHVCRCTDSRENADKPCIFAQNPISPFSPQNPSNLTMSATLLFWCNNWATRNAKITSAIAITAKLKGRQN